MWPCDVPDGCPLSQRFAKDDPNGDAFVANHVFWLYVKNDTDAAAKGELEAQVSDERLAERCSLLCAISLLFLNAHLSANSCFQSFTF